MKGRKQKILNKTKGNPPKDRTAFEGYGGAQTFMWIAENNLIEPDARVSENGLLEYILSPANLRSAYQRVKSNGGAAGVDKMETKSLKEYFINHKDELVESILQGRYKPNPVRRVEIPKDDGSKRLLGIPTVVDRVIQQAIFQVLNHLFEPQFSENSYGFRPRRNAHQALRKCKEYITEGYNYVVDMDLEKFFDTVNHSKLIEVLSRTIKDGRVISLIHKYLNAGVQIGCKFEPGEAGVPQGGPLSPLLSNVLLTELDRELERRGHRHVRYADDFVIFCKSKRASLRAMDSVTRYIQNELFLKVNTTKSQCVNYTKVKFLGYTFYKIRGEAHLRLHRKTAGKLKEKIRYITSRSNGWGDDKRKLALRQFIIGWLNYYQLADMKSFLPNIDEWYRRRLRMVIWKQWKRVRTRMQALLKLGVPKWQAYQWASTRQGYWRTARSAILTRTITNERLKRSGYLFFLDYFKELQSRHQVS